MSLEIKTRAVVALLSITSIGVLVIARESQAGKVEHWITVDEKELSFIQNALFAGGDADLKSVEVQFTQNGIAILRLDDPQIEKLSRAMHEDFHKCSRFIAHESKNEAINSIAQLAAVNPAQQFVEYTIDNQINVNALLA